MSTQALPAPYLVTDIEIMAKAVARSKLYAMDEAQALTLMLLAQAKGLHPIEAVERYHIIQGRPAMKADAMLAEFQARGGMIEWRASTATECEALFAHPTACPKGFTARFTLADAKAAELAGKDNWRKYPAAMLRARVVSAGIRAVLPGVVSGIYTPEEIADMAPALEVPFRVEPAPAQAQAIPAADDPAAEPANVREYLERRLARFGLELHAGLVAQKMAGAEAHRALEEATRGGTLPNVFRLANALATLATKGDATPDGPLLAPGDITDTGTPEGKRVPRKMWVELDRLWQEQPAWFDGALEARLREDAERFQEWVTRPAAAS